MKKIISIILQCTVILSAIFFQIPAEAASFNEDEIKEGVYRSNSIGLLFEEVETINSAKFTIKIEKTDTHEYTKHHYIQSELRGRTIENYSKDGQLESVEEIHSEGNVQTIYKNGKLIKEIIEQGGDREEHHYAYVNNRIEIVEIWENGELQYIDKIFLGGANQLRSISRIDADTDEFLSYYIAGNKLDVIGDTASFTLYKSVSKGTIEETWTGGELEKIVKKTIIDEQNKEITEIFPQTNFSSKRIYNNDFLIKEIVLNGSKEKVYTYTYTDNGLLKSETEEYNDQTFRTENEYNPQGIQIKQSIFENGTLREVLEFNNNGNLIQETIYSNGKIIYSKEYE